MLIENIYVGLTTNFIKIYIYQLKLYKKIHNFFITSREINNYFNLILHNSREKILIGNQFEHICFFCSIKILHKSEKWLYECPANLGWQITICPDFI
jgi:hypothetical protein